MIVLPQGLVSKTRRLPLSTIVLVVAMGFFSIIHFAEVKEGDQVFWQSPIRLHYAKQAKAYVLEKCLREQAKSFCVGLEDISEKTILVPKTLNVLFQKGAAYSHLHHLVGYLGDELSPHNLRQNNPDLFKMQQRAEVEKQTFAHSHSFLSGTNISWFPIARSLFLHANWIHLVTNILFLLFLAFPVEERMGGLPFLLTFFTTGAIGSTTQAFLDPNAFYIFGTSAAICGIAGCMASFFWGRYAKVLVSFFFIKSKSFYVPILFYSSFFLFGSLVVDFLLPYHHIAHVAHFVGFASGALLGWLYKTFRSLPNYFVFPYELKFEQRLQKNLSQYDRIKVLAEWLYYSPTNMYAFRELAREVKRSSTNPKVNKVLNQFRVHAFPELYLMNKRNLEFLKLLPVRWLSWASVGHSPSFLRSQAQQFADERKFEMAFKLYFLTLNEVGWRDNSDAIELFKNFKKATIDEHFNEETQVLKERHSPFGRFLAKRENFHVA